MMSVYLLPKGVKKRIDHFRARLLWQEDQGVRKYHLVSWPIVCQPKDQGGLGVVDLTIKNILFFRKMVVETGEWKWFMAADA